jgi:hypothetical protein
MALCCLNKRYVQRPTLDGCYDFSNIFAKKNLAKMFAFSKQNTATFSEFGS